MDPQKQDNNSGEQKAKEPFIRTFSSQEEAELFLLKKNMERSDMDKFRMFCRMIRIGKMLASTGITRRY